MTYSECIRWRSEDPVFVQPEVLYPVALDCLDWLPCSIYDSDAAAVVVAFADAADCRNGSGGCCCIGGIAVA